MPIRVVAAVIKRNGRHLVCERPVYKRHGGLWEFPGGKVEEGESDFMATERELREELGVQVVSVAPMIFAVADPGSDFLIQFLPVTIEGEPRPLEHTRVLWATDDELLALPLAPSDLKFANAQIRGR